ncbi:MAG: ABC transporter permease [Desulfobacterales bacterium]|nr:ABC transporter permease [Desulfobacterales bacterium]
MAQSIRTSHSDQWRKIIFYTFCGLILFFVVFPIFVIIPISFSSAKYLTFPPPGFSLQWYLNYFNRPDWIRATWLSFKIAILVAFAATVLGTLAATAIVRGKFRGKNLIYAFVISPLIMPIIIIALASYFLLAKLKLIGSQFGLALIHTVIAVPLVVIIVSNTLKNFDVTLEKASMIMGANRIRTFFKVTFPLVKTGILSAAFFAFLTSFDELVIALFVGGTRVVTLPRRMWEGVRMEIDPTLAAVATLLVLFSVCVLGMIFVIQSLWGKESK